MAMSSCGGLFVVGVRGVRGSHEGWLDERGGGGTERGGFVAVVGLWL